MTLTEPDLACHWCGADDQLELIDIGVKIANPQVEFEHTLHRCGQCGKLMAEARWGKQHYLYRALEYPRTFRAPLYVLVYDVACGWCSRRSDRAVVSAGTHPDAPKGGDRFHPGRNLPTWTATVGG